MVRLLRRLFLIVLIGTTGKLYAQSSTPDHLFRIYEDDDFINLWGDGSDNAYTNGTRLDYFYQVHGKPRSFLNKLFPRAGDSSNNTYGWGVEQLMYTPDDIDNPAYQPTDYPWSGGLLATHTLYSYNPDKKYDFLSELAVGVMGPASLARQTQTLVHHIIHYLKPAGWEHQYPNALLLNYNFTIEKQLYQAGKWLELSAGSQASAGTMRNSLTFYPMLRFGIMDSYYNGFFSQYTSRGRTTKGHRRRQLYFFAKPAMTFVFSDALLQGGIFTTNPDLRPASPSTPHDTANPYDSAPIATPAPYPGIHKVVLSINYGAVLTQGDFAISFSQNANSAEMRGLYCHQFGNISLLIAW